MLLNLYYTSMILHDSVYHGQTNTGGPVPYL